MEKLTLIQEANGYIAIFAIVLSQLVYFAKDFYQNELKNGLQVFGKIMYSVFVMVAATYFFKILLTLVLILKFNTHA